MDAKRLLILLVLLAGCSPTTSGNFCQIAPQLRYRAAVYDAMTPEERREHLTYLETGQRLCRWRAG